MLITYVLKTFLAQTHSPAPINEWLTAHNSILNIAMYSPLAAASNGPLHYTVVLYTTMCCPLVAASNGPIHYAVVLYTTMAEH